jgi:hypothetical protein
MIYAQVDRPTNKFDLGYSTQVYSILEAQVAWSIALWLVLEVVPVLNCIIIGRTCHMVFFEF